MDVISEKTCSSTYTQTEAQTPRHPLTKNAVTNTESPPLMSTAETNTDAHQKKRAVSGGNDAEREMLNTEMSTEGLEYADAEVQYCPKQADA